MHACQSIFNKRGFFFVVTAFCLNGLFYFFNTDHSYYSPDMLHGEVGYNVFRYNSFKRNPAIKKKLVQLKQEGGVPLASNKLVDPVHINHIEWGVPQEYNPITDTIGYGVLHGLVWKLTGSLNYRDIQFLQIFMFSILVLLLYAIALMLFASELYATIVCTVFLLFFPLFSLNVQALRDVWSYYAVVVILFVLLRYFLCNASLWYIFGGSLFFSLCQWVRPTISIGLFTLLFVFGVATFLGTFSYAKLGKSFTLFFLVNIGVFWAPFMAYNKTAYNRYVVGPVGQDLIEGLGEFPNEWGLELSDTAFINHIKKTYQPTVSHGSPEFDDYGIVEFKKLFAHRPWFYVSTLIKRTPQLLFPALPWIFHETSDYEGLTSIKEKIMHSFSSWRLFFDFILRHMFIRFLLLIGYLGLLLMIRDQQWFVILLLVIGVISMGLGKFPSHIEYRYLTPFYWPFVFFIAYALSKFIAKEVLQQTV